MHSKKGLTSLREKCRARFTKHGMASNGKTQPIYQVLKNIKQRCNNPRSQQFKNYGGRGIGYDPRWNDFSEFFKDMGPSYKPGLSIERRDNNGDYTKDNCRWVNQLTQMSNTRTNVHLTLNGVTLNLSQWSRKTGLSLTAIIGRIRRKWTPEQILTLPPRTNRDRKITRLGAQRGC
jgi:hypothetical protein